MMQPTRADAVIAAVHRVGEDALLVDLTAPEWVMALETEVRRRWSSGDGGLRVREVVPAAQTLLLDGIYFESPSAGHAGVVSPEQAERLVRELSSWTLTPPAFGDAAAVEVPIVFDGPDLASVAQMWEVSTADAVAAVVDTEFRVAFCGFAPGFAYLAGLPAHRAVPRLTSPRTRVPAGAFGLAGEYAGIYPRSSPGGWQLLGKATGVELWDPARQPPALLTPGTRVRIVAAPGGAP